MTYKSMVLELLQQRPEIHEQLRKERKLLLTTEQYATDLKTCHQAWTEFLSQLRPGSQRTQISSEALEFALKELGDRLHNASWQGEQSASHFLDAAMLFIRKPRTSSG